MPKTETEARAFYVAGFNDHLHLLRTALIWMSKGDLTQALGVATTVRVFVHETSASTPLLKRLMHSYQALLVHDLPELPRRPDGTVASPILRLPLNATVSSAEPHIALIFPPNLSNGPLVTLAQWWANPCLVLPDVGPMTRRELILGMANKEGAHADADVSAKYQAVLASQFMRAKVNGTNLEPPNASRLIAGSVGAQLLDCLERNLTLIRANPSP